MAPPVSGRRRLLQGLLALPAWALAARANAAPAAVHQAAPQDVVADREGAALQPWQPGWLDIHHLATGRGNATFVILPDGSSLLIDAGASNNELTVSAPPRPDGSRRAGVWIARYLRRQLAQAGLAAQLDYLLVSHLHPDHTGDVDDSLPFSAHGSYRLSGVTDVAELLPVGTLIDRGYPDYAYPAPFQAPFADNYRAFVRARRDAGLAVQRFQVGSAAQLAPLGQRPAPLPWEIRNIAGNGEVWSGQGDGKRALFPPLSTLARADWPNENCCSLALRIGYGRFSYFTAGDLTSYTEDGALPWRDVLGPAAAAAGPVTVATADHHGMFDGLNAEVVRALRPKVWVVPTWHIAHPDMLQLERMFSQRLYPGPREVYATAVMQANLLANGRLTSRMRSHNGHVVVRVHPGGERFHVAVTDNGDEQDRVRLLSGPFSA
ncbi:ComEC/Rec2 family competence protein [Duganella vulcania]|uniref:MBL fold metallo-hydrolase n=1 Tax=Duganella vulcania TaxID=2692166 RepID=A0A845GU35_9BURK|nr:MBL fold metallo-hydrolase [Duganella vulcania]MYM96059.1 MBL fold metallo-hydrolase [Duganella vulcania]